MASRIDNSFAEADLIRRTTGRIIGLDTLTEWRWTRAELEQIFTEASEKTTVICVLHLEGCFDAGKESILQMGIALWTPCGTKIHVLNYNFPKDFKPDHPPFLFGGSTYISSSIALRMRTVLVYLFVMLLRKYGRVIIAAHSIHGIMAAIKALCGWCPPPEVRAICSLGLWKAVEMQTDGGNLPEIYEAIFGPGATGDYHCDNAGNHAKYTIDLLSYLSNKLFLSLDLPFPVAEKAVALPLGCDLPQTLNPPALARHQLLAISLPPYHLAGHELRRFFGRARQAKRRVRSALAVSDDPCATMVATPLAVSLRPFSVLAQPSASDADADQSQLSPPAPPSGSRAESSPSQSLSLNGPSGADVDPAQSQLSSLTLASGSNEGSSQSLSSTLPPASGSSSGTGQTSSSHLAPSSAPEVDPNSLRNGLSRKQWKAAIALERAQLETLSKKEQTAFYRAKEVAIRSGSGLTVDEFLKSANMQSTTKKSTTKKQTIKKPTTKKSTSKKANMRKSATRRSTNKKSTTKNSTPRPAASGPSAPSKQTAVRQAEEEVTHSGSASTIDELIESITKTSTPRAAVSNPSAPPESNTRLHGGARTHPNKPFQFGNGSNVASRPAASTATQNFPLRAPQSQNFASWSMGPIPSQQVSHTRTPWMPRPRQQAAATYNSWTTTTTAFHHHSLHQAPAPPQHPWQSVPTAPAQSQRRHPSAPTGPATILRQRPQAGPPGGLKRKAMEESDKENREKKKPKQEGDGNTSASTGKGAQGLTEEERAEAQLRSLIEEVRAG